MARAFASGKAHRHAMPGKEHEFALPVGEANGDQTITGVEVDGIDPLTARAGILHDRRLF
jgi:hypothetical protein